MSVRTGVVFRTIYHDDMFERPNMQFVKKKNHALGYMGD